MQVHVYTFSKRLDHFTFLELDVVKVIQEHEHMGLILSRSAKLPGIPLLRKANDVSLTVV